MSFRKHRNHDHSRLAMMNNVANDDYEDYMEDEVIKISEDDIEIVLNKEQAISNKIKNAKPLRKFAEIGKVLFEMLRDIINGTYPNVPWLTIATITMVFLYILNPFDLIPDFIPLVGYLDDLAVVTIGLGWIETDLHKYLDWRLQQLNR